MMVLISMVLRVLMDAGHRDNPQLCCYRLVGSWLPIGGGGGDVQLSHEQPSFSFSFCNFTAEYVKDMGSVPTSCVLDSLGKIWQC